MNRTRHAHASRDAAAAACAAVLLLALGCGGDDPAAPRRLAATRQASVAQCSGTDTHTKHIKLFACETCHPKGGEFGFSGTLAGGLAVSGTVARQAGLPPSCTVTCHSPDGGTAQPVAWNAGPMSCGSCHPGKLLAAGGSAHARNGERATCEGCHDLGQHMGGAVRLVDGMQPGTDAMCLRCHSGTGGTLGDGPGPLLVGWNDPAGDWHGARTGTGYGGTLHAPYARGEATLPCATCHDAHSSGNEFLLRPIVNAVAVPAGTIGRAGVDAEALCQACHEGDRHATCKSCHTAVRIDLGSGHVWFESSAPAVDPAPPGYPCFWCHGHEGIVRWTQPGSINDDMMRPWEQSCDHCHNFAAPAVETVAPVVASGGPITVTGIGPTSVTITWTTNEASTSHVEYGLAKPSRVATGDPGLPHRVTITDLTPGTTYAYRVRSTDQYRNVFLSPIATFTTALTNSPDAPVVVHTPGQTGPTDELTFTMRWNPVTAPDGDAIEYRMVLAEYPDLSSVVIDTGWISQTSYTASLSTWSALGNYYWHVMARDAVHDVRSSWSTVDSFYAWDSRE